MSTATSTQAAPGVASSAEQARPSGGTRRPAGLTVVRWLVPVAVLVLWQLASITGLLPERRLAAPTAIAATAWDLVGDGQLVTAILVSLQRAAIGFALGAAVAIAVALVAGLGRLGEALLDPLMQMVRTIPLLALVPLFILWFGIGEGPKVLLVALGVAVPVYVNLFSALRGVDSDLIELSRSLRLSRAQRLRHVVLPAALPGLLVGLRQGLGVAWLALIVAELVNADAGLGFLINNARDFLQTDVVVVGIVAYALLGLITDAIVRTAERRALRWRGDGATA